MHAKQIAIESAICAGQAILDVYHTNFNVQQKTDASPLTQADMNAHAIIQRALSKTNLPVLSEEGRTIDYEERKHWTAFWMVDPLDGTAEFVKRNGEFTVNIALIENETPVFGVIYVPVERTLYVGDMANGALKYSNIHTASDVNKRQGISLPIAHNRDHLIVVGSRSHMSPETKAYIAALTPPKPTHALTPSPPKILSKGSSLKLCMVAEGTADIYPRFGPTMEWDTAAGDAICRAAGCRVIQHPSQQPVAYNKADLHNPWFVVTR